MPIKLHKFGEAWGIADPSPFCLKLESFLRESNLPYEIVPFDRRRLARAPKGKLPFIEDEDGSVVGDSALIIERLSRTRGLDLDAPLSHRQRAVSLGFRRMLDEHFYWVGVYFRWLKEPGWSVIRQAFFSKVAWPLRPLIEMTLRRKIVSALRAQGTGRHSPGEILKLGCEDMQALSRLLGGDPYFFATDRPTLLDISAHAHVAEIIAPPIDSPLKRAVLDLGNLTDHFERLQARLYRHAP